VAGSPSESTASINIDQTLIKDLATGRYIDEKVADILGTKRVTVT